MKSTRITLLRSACAALLCGAVAFATALLRLTPRLGAPSNLLHQRHLRKWRPSCGPDGAIATPSKSSFRGPLLAPASNQSRTMQT